MEKMDAIMTMNAAEALRYQEAAQQLGELGAATNVVSRAETVSTVSSRHKPLVNRKLLVT